jgi:RNA polymerase sigma factor (sigma-70 family)
VLASLRALAQSAGQYQMRSKQTDVRLPTKTYQKGPERVRGKAYRGLRDGQLVELVTRKDAGALEALYDRYGRAAYSLARRILTEETLAQDVVQEVFLSLWRDARRFDAGRGTVATYLLSMTHHRAVDVVRREENLRRWRTSDEGLELEPDPKARVEDEVVVSERRAEVRAALAELPAVQREALLLAYFGGYTQREVATLVGVPLGTVKTRMAAGMRKLKEALQDAGREEQHPWTHQ